MTRGRVAYEVLDHTADSALLVRAGTLAQLFEHAACAMFDQMADIDAVRAGPLSHRVVLRASDRETLLVSWLSELLSWASAKGALLSAFDVALGGDTALEATAWGELIDGARHRFETELKAVTYHELAIDRDADGYWARVLFDV